MHKPPGRLRCLTDREREVLLWVAEGKTNAEIGLIVEARPRTVAKHLERIFQKLGVESRTAARVAFDALGRTRRWDLRATMPMVSDPILGQDIVPL